MRTIQIANLQSSAATSVPAGFVAARCDGCKECHWIAPGGQLWRGGGDPQPHMHCRVLGRLDVVANKHGDYVHTLIPVGCPEHQQPGLF